MLKNDEAGRPFLHFTSWLPTYLGRLGYETIAYAPPLGDLRISDPTQLLFDRVDRISREVSEQHTDLAAGIVVDHAIADLRAATDQPPFMWIHLMDPHAPHGGPIYFPGGTSIDDYDSELAWVDEQLARLWTAIENRFGEDEIIIVTADHGEQFGERGFFSHAWSSYEPEVRVPYIIHSPRVKTGEVSEPVSTISIAATVLDLIGVETPAHKLSALSVASSVPEEAVFSYAPVLSRYQERRREVVLVHDGWKLFWHRTNASKLLFKLDDDPLERHNLVHSEPERVEAMMALMRARLEREPE